MKAIKRNRKQNSRKALPSKQDGQLESYIGLRGGIEVVLRNAFTGEELIHHKGPNNVLYIGRNMIMTRSYTSASQLNLLQPCVVIGSGSVATNATHSAPGSYFTFKTGGFATTTASAGAAQPILQFTGSWESTELNAAGFNSIREFLLGFNSVSNSGSSGIAPYLCRYLSSADINATTSNQLLVTYTISF